MARSASREVWWLAGLLTLCGVLLFATSVPESFTVDDCNYLSSVLALRHGGLTVPGTEGLTPTNELCAFDPTGRGRVVTETPVAPTVPPLYAPFGTVFSVLGWRGLQLLNVLSFLAVAALVFALAKRLTRTHHARWVAVAAFVLGGYSLDYAQGVWPQMLCALLTTAAVWLSLRGREQSRLAMVAGAGVLAGVAAGIRYQNIVFAAALGLTVLLWSARRLRSGAAYAGGVALPVFITAAINSVRLGSWNPISKGPGYLASGVGAGGRNPVVDMLLTVWVRLVDYSAHPPFASEYSRVALPKDPVTGVFFVVGGLKKALLQSAPWAAIALVVLVLAWTAVSRLREPARRELRVLSILVVAVVALFAWAGLERHDGWGFNQRYLLEIVPLVAVAAAVVVDRWQLDVPSLTIGGATGLAAALVPLSAAPEHPFRQRCLMVLPILLATLLLAAWVVPRFKPRWHFARPTLLAACIGWAFAVHVGDDIRAARGLRTWHGYQRQAVAAVLPPEPAALFAGPGQYEGLCRLLLDHDDLVMVDPWMDDGRTAGRLMDELFAAGRRIFIVGGMPEHILRVVIANRPLRFVSKRPIPIAEILPSPRPPPVPR